MKYYIFENKQLKRVKRFLYEKWIMNDFISYLLPDYSALIDDKIYAIETIYAGALDDDEDVLPFVLCRKNSELKLELEGVCFKTLTEEVEYFKSYETFRSRYFFLIAEIENNFA